VFGQAVLAREQALLTRATITTYSQAPSKHSPTEPSGIVHPLLPGGHRIHQIRSSVLLRREGEVPFRKQLDTGPQMPDVQPGAVVAELGEPRVLRESGERELYFAPSLRRTSTTPRAREKRKS
jgi:hypothetical protein